jgi:hypothetical protein
VRTNAQLAAREFKKRATCILEGVLGEKLDWYTVYRLRGNIYSAAKDACTLYNIPWDAIPVLVAMFNEFVTLDGKSLDELEADEM